MEDIITKTHNGEIYSILNNSKNIYVVEFKENDKLIWQSYIMPLETICPPLEMYDKYKPTMSYKIIN
jgi:hypothetical protein